MIHWKGLLLASPELREAIKPAISYFNYPRYQYSYLIAAVSAIIKSCGSCDENITEVSHSSQKDFSFRDLCYKTAK